MDFSYTIWIPLIPFLAFFVVGILGNKKSPVFWGMVSTGAIAASSAFLFDCLPVFFPRWKSGGNLSEDHCLQYDLAQFYG